MLFSYAFYRDKRGQLFALLAPKILITEYMIQILYD